MRVQHRHQRVGGDVVVARQARAVGDDHVVGRDAPARQRPLVGAARRGQRIGVRHVRGQPDARQQRLRDQVLAHLHQPHCQISRSGGDSCGAGARRARRRASRRARRCRRDIAGDGDAGAARARRGTAASEAARRVVDRDGAHVVAIGARHAAGDLERPAERPAPGEDRRRHVGVGGLDLAGQHEVGRRRLEPHRRRRAGPRPGGDHRRCADALVELQRAERRGVAEGEVVPRPAGAERLVGPGVVVADEAALDPRHAEQRAGGRPTRRGRAPASSPSPMVGSPSPVTMRSPASTPFSIGAGASRGGS